MAEAIRNTAKHKKDKNITKSQEHEDEQNEEITDTDLKNRLKSLTKFINNLEPTAPQQDLNQPQLLNQIQEETVNFENNHKNTEDVNDNLPKTSQDTKYYDMISEKVIESREAEKTNFSHLNTILTDIKINSDLENNQTILPSAPALSIYEPSEQVQAPQTVDFNLEQIKQVNKLNYPRLNWNQTLNNQTQYQNVDMIDSDLLRFYENDQLCKDLEVYYKCKLITSEKFNSDLSDFIKSHSNLNEFQFDMSNTNQHRKNEFYELLKDYHEARKLVLKCERHINEFKWTTIAEQMNKIWSFEKYTIESFGTCGDQQRCKHELTSEKAYLNRLELTKLQSMFYELRFNLIKNGLISSQFCSKLAKLKLESFLHDFLLKFDTNNQLTVDSYLNFNHQFKIIIDVLFYFYRKHTMPNQTSFQPVKTENSNIYYEIDETTQIQERESPNQGEEDDDQENFSDEVFKNDLKDWIKTLSCLLMNRSNQVRLDSLKGLQSQNSIFKFSTLHFNNIFFILQHLLRSTESLNFNYLIQIPFLALESNNENMLMYKQINLNNSKSDQLINLYFDNYLKIIASFSYDIKYRQEFLGLTNKLLEILKFKNKTDPSNLLNQVVNGAESHNSNDQNWQFIDLEGETESIESVLIDINEDDLIKLYYQIPFNSLFSFLWFYLEYQSNDLNKIKNENDDVSLNNIDFRKGYVSMKIISFLDNLAKLSIRSLLIYNRLKYKNFSKLIGKTLREIIKFISNLLTRNYRVDNLRIHYDNFIKRIFTTIIYSPRLKSIRWTILNQLNISKLNLSTKWVLLSIMCGIDVFHPNFELIFRSDLTNKPIDYIQQACQNDLESILVKDSANTADIELLSFMKTLHFLIDLESNEIIDLDQDQVEFMSSVVKVIFKIAYCYKSTQEICYKEGNSILFAICSIYPSLIGFILAEIDSELNQVGKKALYLCADLPFNKWLPYIDCRKDIFFIQKCLLMNMTNSILFRLGTNLIDNFNFNYSTKEISEKYLNNSNRLDSNFAELISSYGLVDLSTVFKIRLSIIIFELHCRLTNYNYFTKSLTEESMFDTNISLTSNISSNDELNQHYYKLSKDKRLDLVYWIWCTIYRMNLFMQIDSLKFIGYLEDLTSIYSINNKFDIRMNDNYLTRFYQNYLSSQLNPETESTVSELSTSSNNNSTIRTVLQPKCPLESYLRLIFTCSGHDLNYLFDHSIEFIQTILSINKKNIKLHKISYLILFNWFENLISKFSIINISKNETENRLSEFRLAKELNMGKLSQIILHLFSYNSTQYKLTENYCSKLQKRLKSFKSLNSRDQIVAKLEEENFQNYLLIWIEIFMKSVKNWHKYKNIVKLIDFLISFSFQFNQNTNLINMNLLEEFVTFVRNDFGISDSNNSNLNHENRLNEFGSTSSINSHSNQSSNWFQPSINWISSSLTYVVSSTTNTVGAAIGALSNNNSEFFESNQQQFTYDKRLYKECPYVGFYLSLCEERIEAQLSLWTLFQSYLLGVNDPLDSNPVQSNLNSVSFIESCWRKTLNYVNKFNNVNLNLSPQRLMLFKWCERAIELPYEHPLLILYWQKFFSIYLDKEYLSNISSSSVSTASQRGNSYDLELTSTGPVTQSTQSVTFKLFTSTSQLNSLLKHMKKHLELTSQHYAYQIQKNDNQSSQIPSAPLANYHFNEFMSKLFYALSLWIDESRLHDPTLYLPALPAHYEPNLLAKIFAKHSDLWIEFLDMNKINYHVETIINSGEKLISSISEESIIKRKTASNLNGSDLFFKQADRLVISLPRIEELNLKFISPLKEKFGDSIENLLRVESIKTKSSKDEVQLIVNISEHLLKNIYKYNKDFINHSLNHMLKLDDKLTNKLLIHLWHNEMCEKYVQVPCSSMINPMHQCTRPAMVKFVYEIATKRDQFRHEIKENRLSHDKLISNFVDLNQPNSSSRFPHDDIIISMVALSQLIKRLLRNHHLNKQENEENSNEETSIHLFLTKLFYLLIDLYETNMNHPNDVLNPAKMSSSSSGLSSTNLTGWSILFKTNDSFDTLNEQFNSDSIHLFMFDLIHLIGANFIQSSNLIMPSLQYHKKTNQHILLEKIIQKLTSTINLTNVLENNASLGRSSTSNSTASGTTAALSTRRSSSILLNLTRNKLSLMSLCAQYVEPNDLDLFNEFYTSILSSISFILLNENQNASNSDPNMPSLDSTEMINQKFSIILQLLSKFSFINLSKLLKSSHNTENNSDICTNFVEININFLTDLNLDLLESTDQNKDPEQVNIEEVKKRDLNLKQIINQCIDNMVSILNVEYPFYFEYMLKKCLEFSSKNFSVKYSSRHLNRLVMIFKQNELANLGDKSFLKKDQYELTFKFLSEFFSFEKLKFKSQKRSFYSHWANFTRQLTQFYSCLFLTYFDKYVFKDLNQENKFEKNFEILFKMLTDLYFIWVEPSSILEITSISHVNVKETYKNDVSSIESRDEILSSDLVCSPQSSILLMIDSFLLTFHSLIERFNMFGISKSNLNSNQFEQNSKNYALNKLIHFYYEQIACPLNSASSINDNSLECYHTCMNKYSSTWFGNGLFEPDYRSINIMSELCTASNSNLIKFIAFNLVCYLDLNRITESYFRKLEIMPIQINDLLKCILQLLVEFCLRDSIRESVKFESLLRPIYNQAEVLQCWSMLSDTSYSSVVIERFLPTADYRYAFASRGTERGVLMNLLKSSAEFYTLADRNSLSCFSSAKRRCYLRVVCELLLKPNMQSIKTDLESFQNCIMNLLTDIETFSISAVSSNSEEPTVAINSNLNHEIQLLIDESLNLISSSRNPQLNELYQNMFETWLSSSKDSPILTHFINRISKNYNLLILQNNNEKYCNLLELCLEMFFETNRLNLTEDDFEKAILINQITDQNSCSIGWKILMDDIDFIKLNGQENDLFEFKLLEHSTYLLLNCYMSQRLALLKATFNDCTMEFYNEAIKYTQKIIDSFFTSGQVSKPKPSKEEKIIVILNKLIEIFLNIIYNSNSRLIESKVGEQLIKLTSLLSYYGEDTLSAQNPTNDGQSIGSELLSSIGLNILARKSQYSIKFRFFCRSMAICLLKQIFIFKESDLDLISKNKDQNSSSNLFPNLGQIKNDTSIPRSNKLIYKIRMSHLDLITQNDPVNFNKPTGGQLSPSSSSSGLNLISTSLPNTSYMSSSLKTNQLPQNQSPLITSFNQQLKHTAYQFHLIYQTKVYTNFSDINLVELANYINQHLTQKSQYFCLPQCFNMSKYLCAKLFSEKFYLF